MELYVVWGLLSAVHTESRPHFIASHPLIFPKHNPLLVSTSLSSDLVRDPETSGSSSIALFIIPNEIMCRTKSSLRCGIL